MMRACSGAVLGIVLSLASVFAGDAAALPVEIAPKDTNIVYIGRFDTRDEASPKAGWTGSTVAFKFHGKTVNAKLHGNAYLQVAIDGQPTSVIHVEKATAVYSIATGLEDKDHLVELVKRNEAAQGSFQFQGLQLETGAKLLPYGARSDKRIEVIGDSISCGYGNEVAGPGGGNPADKQNGYMVYGTIAARTFGGEAAVLAWSGRTLWPGNTMPELYDRAIPQDAQSAWDHAKWVPGVVVISLGTNDFRAGPPDRAKWTGAYKEFIARIRKTAPDAHIFCCTGSMWTNTLGQWNDYVKSVADDLNTAGDKKVHFLPFDIQDKDKDGLGGDWHPNVKTQIKMAAKLSAAIQKEVGWTPAGK